jgi:mono/diheme cytochrome c family protein
MGYDVTSECIQLHHGSMTFIRWFFPIFLLLALAACTPERRKTDAELGLNPEQARGRRVFDSQCARCHDPYSASAAKGPSLRNLYKRQYLPSGLPANDEHVTDSILRGRKMMPAFNQTINEEQLQYLLAYLKTL